MVWPLDKVVLLRNDEEVLLEVLSLIVEECVVSCGCSCVRPDLRPPPWPNRWSTLSFELGADDIVVVVVLSSPLPAGGTLSPSAI